MAKILNHRYFRLPLKLNQKVYYIGLGGQLFRGVVREIDIYFLDSGKEVDIDFRVHPIIEGKELEIVDYFSDYEVNKKVFTSERKARRYIKTSR